MDRPTSGSARRSALDRFFFAPMSATPLAMLRIATGLLMVVWSVTLLNDAEPLLTWLRVSPDGEIGWWQFLPNAPDGAVMAMVWLLLLSSVMLTLGWWTTIVAWLTFLLVLVLQRYNPVAFNGGDFILRTVLLLGLAVSPCGVYLSLDSYRQNRGWRWEAPDVPAWGLRFIQLHISLGYILTVLLKLTGNEWVDGMAIWYALNLEDLIRFRLPRGITAPPVGALLSWGTLVLELGVGIGVWIHRLRRWAVLGGIILHLGIALTFEIGFFSYVMLVSYLSWLPAVRDVRELIPDRFRRVSRTALPEGAS